MAQSAAYKHYLRALSRWPKDPLRPDCQFQEVIRRRVAKRFYPVAGESAVNEAAELEQVNALYSLLSNRYTHKFKITGDLMRPKSGPEHYTRLIKELEEAPGRSRWGRFTNKWKGFLRFS
ncbi:hypothetical protein LSUE1_G007350 [Lachnellula suecica]|uniref:Mitochondrial nucleoid factor 1 n=1 Tax=Lachnellula suecica TaxID=602035 RepID=A0A8T9BWH9_9HELO|nr:hypothetical protein LSUE1_G007350 [Lachnellula suecica]